MIKKGKRLVHISDLSLAIIRRENKTGKLSDIFAVIINEFFMLKYGKRARNEFFKKFIKEKMKDVR